MSRDHRVLRHQRVLLGRPRSTPPGGVDVAALYDVHAEAVGHEEKAGDRSKAIDIAFSADFGRSLERARVDVERFQ
ncbi:hypothetical protein [Caballeronia sp. LZ035]|uniref:hypothetical protein n=1 Tax=Caballeronia sp. LZ035 TaxID=3038568 RepID=UPI002861E0C2|nr:hypothetical protein [Caballeronia sp. LZ035]MDR5760575.1 hypothetical protein [Caballeronia sp. LZ035]